MNFPRLKVNHMVAILAVCLALSAYLAMRRFGFPEKVCIGTGFLCVLVVAIFWSCVILTDDEDEDD
jgi:hypothetical protein